MLFCRSPVDGQSIDRRVDVPEEVDDVGFGRAFPRIETAAVEE